MEPPTPPKVTGVEVEPAEPTEADSASIALLSADSAAMSADTIRALPRTAQVVKVRFRSKPPITSMAWGLYVGDVLIPKYWEYEDGIYFTVIDPQFFSEYKGKPLRFSQNGVDFFDTGMKLPGPAEPKRKAAKPSKKRATKGSKKRAAKASKSKAAKASKGKKR